MWLKRHFTDYCVMKIECFASRLRLMVDCLQSDSLPVDSIIAQDGTVKTGFGCLTATIQRCMLSDHVVSSLF